MGIAQRFRFIATLPKPPRTSLPASPNDKAQLPGRLSGQYTSKDHHAGPVSCSDFVRHLPPELPPSFFLAFRSWRYLGSEHFAQHILNLLHLGFGPPLSSHNSKCLCLTFFRFVTATKVSINREQSEVGIGETSSPSPFDSVFQILNSMVLVLKMPVDTPPAIVGPAVLGIKLCSFVKVFNCLFDLAELDVATRAVVIPVGIIGLERNKLVKVPKGITILA